jgi:succinate-semialdehyde dehydrogenase/glutarate-semialdehyde dehydrogenase
MELGGHSPTIIFDDADIERAADLLAVYKFRNAGQVCITPTRFFIQEKAYDRFMARFLDKAKSIRVGNGLLPDTQMGPLAHSRRLTAMQAFIDDARARGGRIETGGERIGSEGSFFAPTVMTELPEDSMMMTTESFGPLAACLRFKQVEEVIERANQLPYGLAAYAFTTNTKRALAVQNGLEAGMVNINHTGMALAEMPIGGVKDSGIGSEGGIEGFDGYLTTKFVTQMD